MTETIMQNIAKYFSARKFTKNSRRLHSDLFKKALISRYAKHPATIVQIGVCDGRINDPIYEILRNDIETKTIILIEPQPDLIEKIVANYAFQGDARIFNCAIGPLGQISLYRLAEKYHGTFKKDYLHDAPDFRVPAGFVSANRNHVINHIKGKLPNNTIPEDAIEEFIVESRNLMSVLDETKIESFDVLQVDCEGFDDIVLYNCNVDVFRPSIINFEHMHLSQVRKRRAAEFLKSLGYNIFEYSQTDTLATTFSLEDIK